jgi:hypothetical protein
MEAGQSGRVICGLTSATQRRVNKELESSHAKLFAKRKTGATDNPPRKNTRKPYQPHQANF